MIHRSCRMEENLTALQLAPTAINMAIFRQYIAPFLVLLVFLIALIAVSARIFLPSDMAAPAPIEEESTQQHAQFGSANELISLEMSRFSIS